MRGNCVTSQISALTKYHADDAIGTATNLSRKYFQLWIYETTPVLDMKIENFLRSQKSEL